LCCRRC